MSAPTLDKLLREYSAHFGGDGGKCRIRDPSKVESLLTRMLRGGASRLQVIADFDMTMTRFHKDGEPCLTCHAIIDTSPLMSDEYRAAASAVYKKYSKIAVDPHTSVEEKTPLMAEWYRSCQKLLLEHKISRSMIKEMVATAKSMLRDKALDVLAKLNEEHVPFLIFSAGDGDILEEVLHRDRAFFPNIKVISNYMIFDDGGYCVGFKDPLIHVYSKNATALEGHSTYFEDHATRNNVILLGDALGDLDMDNGVLNPGAVLKIGFLNDKNDPRLDTFTEGFDVVLVDDQTFAWVDSLINVICSSQSN